MSVGGNTVIEKLEAGLSTRGNAGTASASTCHTPGSLKFRAAFWVLGAASGFLQALFSRFDIVNDTVPYLDMGNRFFQGNH